MSRCAYPWQQMIIDLTGEVVPCCYWSGYGNTGKPLGNTNRNSIDEIWNGEEYKYLRSRLAAEDFSDNHPCGNCMAARAANGVFPRFTWPTPFTSEEGFCNLAQLPEGFWQEFRDTPSAIELFEDGTLLTQRDALHADIRTIGMGRYSVANGWLWFSSSDNSDPTLNGRTYALRCGEREVILFRFDATARSGENLRKAYEEYRAGIHEMSAAPSMISYISTADCNIDCPGCSQNLVRYAKVQHRKETTEDVLAHIPGLVQFIWHGGEPYLIKRFRDFINGFETEHNPNLSFGFTSNGMMITAIEAEKLKKFPRLNASVSIDSFTPEVFEKIRAGGVYDRVVENMLRLTRKNNGTDWIVSVGMIVCKSNIFEIDRNVAFAIEHELGLNLSPVVVYPVNEQLNIFEDFEKQTAGWLAALQRARRHAVDARGANARALSQVDFSGMIDEIERIVENAAQSYRHTLQVPVIIFDQCNMLPTLPNAALIAYVDNVPIAYRMLSGSGADTCISLPSTRLPTNGRLRIDLLHSVYEPFGVMGSACFEISDLTQTPSRGVEVYVPEYRGSPRGRNIGWSNYGATTPDGNQVVVATDVFNTYRNLYGQDVDLTKDVIKLARMGKL